MAKKKHHRPHPTAAATPTDDPAAREMAEDVQLQSDSSRVAGRVARTYAEALLAVAEQRGQADEVGEELKELVGGLFADSPEVAAFFRSAAEHRVRKDELLQKMFDGRATPLVLDFLRLLNRKGRLDLIRLIAVAYRNLRDTRANRARVLVESAAPLSEKQLDDLKGTLDGILHKTAVLVTRVNPDLIGGLIVHVGDKVFDTSVRTKLQNVRTQLLERGNHEIQRGRDRFSHN
jgi:F-type H+-transporting ATPase subunit delta